MAHLKGQNVNIYRKVGDAYEVLAQASKSCDFSLTPNTTDGASKADANPMWDNPIFTYCDWSLSNESFIVSVDQLNTLIGLMMKGEEIEIIFDANTAGIKKSGKALLTSLEVSAPSDDYASLSLSLEGTSALADTTETVTAEETTTSKIRGKQLMVAYNTGTTASPVWSTFCAATSHSLSLSAQTSDTKTKDDNELAISKEITGFSMTLSTENLVALTNGGDYGVKASTLLDKSLAGTTLPLKFGYYDDTTAKGKAVQDLGISHVETGWGAPTTLVCTADCICTSYSMSAANKENSTISAEFTAQGKPTFATE